MTTAVGVGPKRFQLTGADGRVHEYLVQEHPGEEGMGVLFDLIALGAPTLLGLAAAALKADDLIGTVFQALRGGEDTERPVTSGDTGKLSNMIGSLDLGQVGVELSRSLATGRGPKLARAILSKSFRDGKQLADDGHFSLAYQANYAELMQALWKVCEINRFFPQLSTWLSSPANTTGSGSTEQPAA